ncbi:MAG: D-glycerate dehydrogenase, partial [Candidatus Latescibacteria bacterium]|nr:D-glycerate dehydrogenase [Candidatus Latescibacterota bacterium]
MTSNVYVTRKIPEESIEILRAACDIVDINPHDRALSRDEFLSEIEGRDGLLCLLTETVDDEALDAAKGVRGIANYAVGYNNIDVPAATQRGIPVSNTPGVLTDTTADLAWGLMFAVARRIVESDCFMREGRFHGWDPLMLLGTDITGKTLGILGGGRIGAATARRAAGFSMPVVYHSRNRHPEIEGLGAEYRSMDALLQESDYVSIHTPLTDETTHLIGSRELGLMKPSAFLINTSRGPVVDEAALVDALRRGKIAGAGLDVFEREPD